MRLASLLSILLIPLSLSTAMAEKPRLVIKDVSGIAGDPIVVVAETSGRVVRWKAVTRGVTVLSEGIVADPKACIIICRKPGNYTIHAVTAVGDEPSDIVTFRVIARAEDDDPSPPNPPVPPVPPVPPDPLAQKIRDAWPKAPTAKDKDAAMRLQALYIELAITIDETRWKTVGDFLVKYREVASKMVDGDVIIECRKIAGAEVFSAFPTDFDAQLTDEVRKRAKALFERLAIIFKGLA